ncbi:MAG TPA: hypothetical protein PKC56_04495, partial [Rhodocyclaceae bacterium]|nr:hypothetical protein [Rhodocyclaceae bacterium]
MMTPALPHDWPWQPAPALPRTLRLALTASIGVHVLALMGHYGLLPNPSDSTAPGGPAHDDPCPAPRLA